MKRLIMMITVFALVTSGFISCKSTFTAKLRGEFNSNDIAIEKIQFYNSGRVTLERESKLNEKKVSRTGAFKKKKREIQYIVRVYSGTPGVCIKEEGDVLFVSFDIDDKKFLPFKLKKGKYYLMHEKGKIEYNGARYKVTWGKNTYLKIMVDESDKDWKRSSAARGRRVTR